MLPQEYKPEVVPPSLIFGPQHLLRLFVKLPEILGRMKIEEKRLTMLLKFINEFLEFLVVYEKDLFSELAYEKNAEIWQSELLTQKRTKVSKNSFFQES